MKDLLTNSIVAITQFQAAFANVDQIVPTSGSHSTTDIIEPAIKNAFWKIQNNNVSFYWKLQLLLWFRLHIHWHNGFMNLEVPASHFNDFKILAYAAYGMPHMILVHFDIFLCFTYTRKFFLRQLCMIVTIWCWKKLIYDKWCCQILKKSYDSYTQCIFFSSFELAIFTGWSMWLTMNNKEIFMSNIFQYLYFYFALLWK